MKRRGGARPGLSLSGTGPSPSRGGLFRCSRSCRSVVFGVLLGAALAHILFSSVHVGGPVREPPVLRRSGFENGPVARSRGQVAIPGPVVAKPPAEVRGVANNDGPAGLSKLKLHSPPLDRPVQIPGRKCRHEAKYGSSGDVGARNVVEYRDKTQREWYTPGCKQWGLTGDYTPRKRKIYYSFMFADEADILSVVLHEIYPVVDVIIILECTETWQGESKPLFFPRFNATGAFDQYADKIRYLPYDFGDKRTKSFVSRCMDEELAGPNWPPGMMQCRWLRQWGARDYIATGAYDIRPHDAFIVADLDELLAREFLQALKNCDVWPEGPGGSPTDCGRMGVFTYGHKYYFDCTVDRRHGHYHPNIALGRCLKVFGAEELKRWWAEPKKYFPKPKVGLVSEPTKMAGPGGWHMHSFLTTARVLWKWFSRSGRSSREHSGRWDSKWDDSDLEKIKNERKTCSEDPHFMGFDAAACEPLPHLIREDPQGFEHFVRYVPDIKTPDRFQIQPWYHERLLARHDDAKGPFRGEF